MFEDIRPISAAIPEGIADFSADAGGVSRDMECIFGVGTRVPTQSAPRPADPVRSISSERSAPGYTWFLAALVLALSVLMIAGAAWLAPHHRPKIVTAQAIGTVGREASQAAPAKGNPVARQKPVAVAPPRKSKAAIHRATRAAVVVNGGARCSRLGGGARARCMRPYVLAADRQLRSAYARAARAGVGPRTLSAYRKRWAQLRGRANSNPVTVTAAYRQMARQLDVARRKR